MGLYAVQQNLEDAYGTINIRDWSRRDNKSLEIDADVVNDALDFSDQQIHGRFRDGVYVLPFAFEDTQSKLAVQEWSVVLATWWLFKFRKVNSPNNPKTPKTNELVNNKKQVEDEMRDYVSGNRRLRAAFQDQDTPTAPVFVTTPGRVL